MTQSPKEKARELIEKYKPKCSGNSQELLNTKLAKQCALIHINQILELPVCWYSKEMSDRDSETYPPEGTKEYWQEVKTEIEKL